MNIRSLSVPIITTLVLPLVNTLTDNCPPTPKILEIWGLEGSSPAMERHDGFIDHLRSDKNFQVTQVFGKWHYNSAYDAVNRLATFADIDLVYAHNDVMALAARDVIMKRDSVSGKRIRFIGIDGVYGDGAGLQAVADEKLEASFQYLPEVLFPFRWPCRLLMEKR